ncbi:MAG: T9SS type A sorting domain-containing protein [candidate division Zixibacteria bacterium]|nr:T9SS type A sorting domain-containing protein [candidate division Zixibacteria bacterium]
MLACKNNSVFKAVIFVLAVLFTLGLTSAAFAGKPAANLDQIRNGPYDDPWDPGHWVNGNAGKQNAHYVEKWSIGYRVVMTDLPTGVPIHLTLGYDIKHSSKHAIDYLTHFQRLHDPSHEDAFGHPEETIDPTIGVPGVSGPATSTFPIPPPSSAGSPVPGQPTNSFNALPASERVMSLWNGTITGVAYDPPEGNLAVAKSETRIVVSFTATSATAVLAWGGHIASRDDWGFAADGTPRSAGGINGSPYHMRLKDWNLNNLGNQDRSLSATAVYARPPQCSCPEPDIVCVGGDVSFTVTVDGGTPPYSYAWWKTSNPGDILSTSATLTILNATLAHDGEYMVVATDAAALACSCRVTLTVTEGPTCLVEPPSAMVFHCDSQTFCVIPDGGTAPFTYRWSTGEITECITVSPPPGSHAYSVVVEDAEGCTTSCRATLVATSCGLYCTLTMFEWGSECPADQQGDPMSTEPGCIRDHYFSDVFPEGVVIGDPEGPGSGTNWYAALWTSASAVEAFLSADGTPGVLTADLTDPVSTPAGELAGQILALRLNVGYSCGCIFDNLDLLPQVACYGYFGIPDACGNGKFDGITVNRFLAIADSAVGGLDVLGSYGATLSDLNLTAACVNELYDDCDPFASGARNAAGAGAKPSHEQGDVQVTVPEKLSLSQNYPNPFNPICNINYALPTDCEVTLAVYNILGQKVRVLVDEYQSAGHKSVEWDGKDDRGRELTTGIYFYRLQAGDFVQSKKMVLIK